ncbi:SOUL heme-binding protein-like [Ectocarpus siliculosus]|uniref:SOUL heme-binding protein-like n=1 Tax=Ectocarpus siliculosus TaxID=2880 RepID=D7G9H5_ECTSI|nr:SOUL heme-binding protein-like [Ectocarpus siliculosus]|eukprot:CBJ28315.1 SOUL heme-binding protein-like [Ectocarpus siliculosus]
MESADYLENKEALKQDLRDEYASFFDNFESERYLPDVQFIDPVTSFTGFDNYKKNLDMLGGRSALGNILFKDAGIILHDIEEPGPFRLRTRWTLTVCFKALPWQPVPRFTGISEYTIDDEARVIKQVDYWDSINLVKGQYQAVSALDGVRDFVGQVLPSPAGAATGGLLLRRAKDYEVRREEGGEVVALREFDETPSKEAVLSNSAALMESLALDGLEAAGEPEASSPGSRMQGQVSVKLTKHDWMTA